MRGLSSDPSDLIFFAISVWLAFGAFLGLLWLYRVVSDKIYYGRAKRDFQKSLFKSYAAFTAIRMTYPGGEHRADAFGIEISEDVALPKPGDMIRVHCLSPGGFHGAFTVTMCETNKRIGLGSPEENLPVKRDPEVYVLVKERLSDALIASFRTPTGTSFSS